MKHLPSLQYLREKRERLLLELNDPNSADKSTRLNIEIARLDGYIEAYEDFAQAQAEARSDEDDFYLRWHRLGRYDLPG